MFDIDPDRTTDNAFFNQIRHYFPDATNATIAADPIFDESKSEIEARLEINDDNRIQARRSLVFCFVANAFESGGASTESSETVAGAVKSVQMGPVRTTYTEGGTQSRSRAQTDPNDRSDFFREKCEAILKRLGASEPESEDGPFVLLTDSHLSE